jgi:hypothetical protein
MSRLGMTSDIGSGFVRLLDYDWRENQILLRTADFDRAAKASPLATRREAEQIRNSKRGIVPCLIIASRLSPSAYSFIHSNTR